jgi:hypothetical protein
VKVTHVANNQLKENLLRSLPDRYGVPQDDVTHLTQDRTIMYADDTTILNIGQILIIPNNLRKYMLSRAIF